MCGRMDIDEKPVREWVKSTLNIEFDLQSNHDLRPTQPVATIGGSRNQIDATWGIRPAWAKKLLINAQGESVAEKRTFSKAFEESRCVVPCSGWYEWRGEGDSRKQKYRFSAADGCPLLMGGILFPEADEVRLVTLTIHPNRECAPFHNRMPQFVPSWQLEQWLSGSVQEALQLISPLPDGAVRIQKI